MTDESDWSIVEAEEASGDRTSRVSSSDSAISSAQGKFLQRLLLSCLLVLGPVKTAPALWVS